MANQIRLKRGSGSAPGTSDLVVGEIAVRTDTGQLFTKKDDGNIEEIGAQSGIADGSITNAKVATNAAIAGSKISPTFNSDITIQNSEPILNFTDTTSGSSGDPDYRLHVNGGSFSIQDATNSNANRFVINNVGNITVPGNFDVLGNIATTGNITGGNILTLSGIAPKIFLTDTNNNDDFEIRNDDGTFTIRNSTDGNDMISVASDNTTTFTGNCDFSAGIDVTGASTFEAITSTGNLTLTSVTPQLYFTDTNHDPDFAIWNHNGVLRFLDITNSSATRLEIQASGLVKANNGLQVVGNITVSGTVDGRDLATDGTKLDGIESNATADQTASEILTLIKTVDGSGSGLDADTLDGISSAGFVAAGGDTMTGALRIDINSNVDGIVGEAYNNFFGLKHADQTLNSEYMILSQDFDTFISATSGYKVKIRNGGNDTTNELIVGSGNDGLTWRGNKVFHAGNDGSGSGLDSDTVDGIQGGSFLRSDATDTATGALTFSRELTFSNDDDGIFLFGGGRFYKKSGGGVTIRLHDANTPLKIENNSGTFLGNVFHSGNDGPGSGLDSDTVDGIHGSSFLRSDAADTCSGKITFSDGIVLPTSGDGIKFGPGGAVNDDAHIEWLGGNNGGYLRISTSDDSDTGSPEYIEFGDYANQNKIGAFTQHVKISRENFLVRTGSNTITQADRLNIASDGKVDIYGNLEVGNFTRSTNGYAVGSTTVISQGRELQNVSLNSTTVTATTQSAGNSTTRVATTAFVSTAIANLIDSSPSTLNTLNELASALGDDPNFATTVTNSIATKLPLAGGTLTGNVTYNDNVKAIFGTNSDFEIFHDVNNTTLIEKGTGNLSLMSNGGQIQLAFNDQAGTFQHMIKCVTSGAVELYHSGSYKFTTNSSGVGVIGNITVSGTVDGRDVAADGSKLDTYEANGSSYLRSDADDTMSANLTIDNGTSTTLSVKCDNAGLALIRANGDSQGTGAVEVGQANNYGGGIAYNGDGSPSFASGETSDHITFYRLDNGTRTEVFHYPYNSNVVNFNARPTVGGVGLVKSDDTIAQATNASTLDNIDSGSFLRSDANDTSSGTIAFGRGNLDPDNFGSFSGGFGGIADGSGWAAFGLFVHGGGTGDAAAIAHNGTKLYFGIQNGSSATSMETWLDVTPGSRIINFQTDNNATNVQIGGNKIFHAGNDGSGSGLDADTLDGVQGSSYLRSDANDTVSGNLNFTSTTTPITTNSVKFNNSEMNTSYYTDATGVLAFDENFFSDTAYGTGATSPMSTFTSNGGGLLIKNEDGWGAVLSSTNIQFCEGNFANLKINNNQVFHAGNDGSGSGLDADLLDGVQGSSYLRSDQSDEFNGDLTIGNGTGNTRLLIKKQDNNVADHIQFYNGTTRVGEIGVEDTTWLRINQETAKNIYTPRYIRADGGFFVDGASKGINGSGNFVNGTIAGASDYSTLLRSDTADTASGDITFSGGAGAVTINGDSDIRFNNGAWTGNAYGKIQQHSNRLYIAGGSSAEYMIVFRGNSSTDRVYIRENGTIYPAGNNVSDLGKSGNRWANLYVNDMHFSNEGKTNDVDGTWGDWTLQEGEEDIFMINNRSGKKFKIAMTPV